MKTLNYLLLGAVMALVAIWIGVCELFKMVAAR